MNEAFRNEDIFNEYGRSRYIPNAPFFRHVFDASDDFAYCIFASQAIMDLITTNISVKDRKYLIDGTFNVVPKGEFNQLLIIHVEYIGKVSFTVL